MVLRMQSNFSFLAALLLLTWTSLVQAAPPLDLTDMSGLTRNVKQKRTKIKDNDIIFTDNLAKPESQLKGLVEFKRETLGYTHPDPEKKAVLRFRKSFRARYLTLSRDFRWIAVELLNGRRKAWVPRDSVEILDKDISQKLEDFPMPR